MAKVFDWFSNRSKNGSKEPPALLVGIGNPGAKYEGTRHNVGFMLIDLLAERANIRLNDKRKDVVLGQGTIAGRSVVLAQPRTFVNKSGIAARYLTARFKAKPTAMLILIDDLGAFPTAAARRCGIKRGRRRLWRRCSCGCKCR